MLVRDYGFLKHRYRELLVPTILMVLSDKLCILVDMVLTGYFVSSLALSSFNLTSPFVYLCGVFYTLFGQGGSLLALRAKASHDDEKADFYFTAAIISMILIIILYIFIVFFFAEDIFIYIFHVPKNILATSLIYLRTFVFFLPFLSYMIFISYFARADGYPNLPFVAFLIANICNIIISYIFMAIFDMGIFGSALGSVLAYAIASLYITSYFFKENRNFHVRPFFMSKINSLIDTIKEFIVNTPEVIGCLFVSFKVSFYTYLCTTYLGTIGLLAFVVYDNCDTIFSIGLSGIMKVTTPIVAVFYKEKDFDSVYYIIGRSLKLVLIVSTAICLFILAYPHPFIHLFSISDPTEVKYITLVLRITAFGLVGRCVSTLLIGYSEAIEENKISSLMSFSQEFLIAVISGTVFTYFFGGIGIWFAIVISDVMPSILYSSYTKIQMKKREDLTRRFFLLGESDNITWTYIRHNDKPDYNLEEQTNELLLKLGEILGDKETIVTNTIRKFGKRILDHDDQLNDIDVIIRKIENQVIFTLTYEGKLKNPITDEDIKNFETIDGTLEYVQVLGFNRTFIYINV